jgi:hypothetical protein
VGVSFARLTTTVSLLEEESSPRNACVTFHSIAGALTVDWSDAAPCTMLAEVHDPQLWHRVCVVPHRFETSYVGSSESLHHFTPKRFFH